MFLDGWFSIMMDVCLCFVGFLFVVWLDLVVLTTWFVFVFYGCVFAVYLLCAVGVMVCGQLVYCVVSRWFAGWLFCEFNLVW